MLIPIEPSAELTVTPQKIEMRLLDGKLLMPETLYQQLGRYAREDAFGLFAALEIFPTAFAARLKWETHRVKAFTEQLRTMLAACKPELRNPHRNRPPADKPLPRS